MRSGRPILSGLGAATSLVAAAGFAFLITAAIVAFHGFPRVAGTGTDATVVVASNPALPPQLVVGAPLRRTPAAVAAAIRAAAGIPLLTAPAPTRSASGLAPGATPGEVPGTRNGRPGSSGTAGVPTQSPSGNGAPPPTTQGVQGVLQDLTGRLGSGVSAVGSTLGSAGAGAGSAVTPVSPLAGGIGAGLAETPGQTASQLGPVVSGAGQQH